MRGVTSFVGAGRECAALLPALLAIALMLVGSGRASAQANDLDWRTRVLLSVYNLQGRAQCMPEAGARSIHILGVDNGGTPVFDPVKRTEILGALSETLARETGKRTSTGENLGLIVGANDDFGDTREVSDAIAARTSADVVIALRPLREDGGSVTTQVALWSRDATRTEDQILCSESVNVSIPIDTVDPLCAQAFGAAERSGDVSRIEAFIDFFPQCGAEIAKARALAEDMNALAATREQRERCERELTRARGENTVAGLTRFLEDNVDCPGRATVMVLRDQLATTEQCRERYAEARRVDTEEGYSSFIAENRSCAQTDVAREYLALKQREAQGDRTVTPQPVQPKPVQPRPNVATFRGYPIPADLAQSECGRLWYSRNLIYHLSGYCFSSAKGRRYFDNSSCWGGQPSAAEVREAKRMQAREKQLGC